MTTTYTPIEVSLDKILLDPNNFRFSGEKAKSLVADARFPEDRVQQAAAKRLETDGLVELKNSIANNGFIPVDSIVVKKLKDEFYVVLEGNRRTAALKWLRRDYEAGQEVDERVRNVFERVPVVLLESDDASDFLSIMGVRHVGGAKQWGGYQSARLVAELRDDHDLSAGEVSLRLGLSVREVNRRYRAYRALVQMRDSEDFGESVASTLHPLFFEAVAVPRLREWLGWSDDNYVFEDETNREIFYSLITESSDDSGVGRAAKITKYTEVRELRAILDVPDAYSSLTDLGKSFSDASAIVKSGEVNRDWASRVGEATRALDHIGFSTLKGFTDVDVALVTKLRDLASEILSQAAEHKTI